MGTLEMMRLIVAGGVMPLKGVKALRAWVMLLALALPLTLTAPITSTANADEFTVDDISEAIKAQENGDYETALKIWRSIVDQADAATQYNLGGLYYNTQGMERNVKEAAEFYRLAAMQGCSKAQYNLGAMYAKGEGVFQDLEKAYMWFALAAVNGVEEAPKARDFIKREMLADSSLGPDAIKRAEKATWRCYDSNYQDCGS